MSLTPGQLDRRRAGISASEIAALAGLSRYRSPLEIFLDKVGQAPDDDGGSYARDLGTEIEAPIARVWAQRNKRWLRKVDTLRHPHLPLAFATPDRAVYTSQEARGDGRKLWATVDGAEQLLEVKSTNWRMRRLWGDEGTDSVPDEYLAQAHWQLGVTGLGRVEFAVDFDKTKLASYVVLANPDVFHQLYEVADAFWADHVLTGTPPPPDTTERYGRALQNVWPREVHYDAIRRPVLAEHEPDLVRTIARWATLKEAQGRVKRLLQLEENRIRFAIGEAAGLTGDFGRITYRKSKDSRRVAWKAYATDLERLAGLCVMALPEGKQRDELSAEVRTLQELHASIVRGVRVLRASFTDGFAPKAIQELGVTLERVEEGLADGEEQREEQQP